MQALLGIDIGTSGCKAVLLDPEGTMIAVASTAYPLSLPRPGWAEQDPEDWIRGACQSIANVMGKAPAVEILGIGLTGQMHGLVALDRASQVLRPAILWNDQRAGEECAIATRAAGGVAGLLSVTNNLMLPGYTGGKLLWMRRHEPGLFARTALILSPKDYLRLRLTGEVATDVSDASGTGLFDTANRLWATGLIEALGLDPTTLPPAVESVTITGRVSALGARLFGVPAGIPVAAGGGDAVVQTFGSGVIGPGDVQTTIGTAGNLAAILDEPSENVGGRLQVFCNVIPKSWHCMGVSLNAGGALGWFRNVLGGAPAFDEITTEAAMSPPGARGLLFLPYLNGERCPYPDPDLRGGFIGLTARHRHGDLARAVMEGVVYSLNDMLGLMVAMGVENRVIRASGGGARSLLWRQIQADVLECDVITTTGASEGAAFGAALIAGLATGVWPDAKAATAACRTLTLQRPDPVAVAAYRRAYPIYRALYPALRETFARLGDAELDS